LTDALQLIKEYVTAVLKYEMTSTEADYEACETIWIKMVELAQGGE
jgi:hypothetical protein